MFDKFPAANPALIEIMEGMLIFNPSKRITISQALEHPYFDNIRDQRKEQVFLNPPNFEFEDMPDITLARLKQYIVSEIRRYN